MACFPTQLKMLPSWRGASLFVTYLIISFLTQILCFWLAQRDLKPQNLLLSTTKTGALLKIADFGFARSLQPQGLAETLCGSPLYMAPEILQFHKYNAKADLWSVGTILFELVVGEHLRLCLGVSMHSTPDISHTSCMLIITTICLRAAGTARTTHLPWRQT